jgi:hypothetical protein
MNIIYNMCINKEEIRAELIRRVEKVSNEMRKNVPKSFYSFPTIYNMANKIKTADTFIEEGITNTLNSILAENNIVFKGNEKQELIDFLKPTIVELLKRHVRKPFTVFTN